ncbi:MAG: hypothetical protein ACJA0E_001826, partial [Bermanella sp.]
LAHKAQLQSRSVGVLGSTTTAESLFNLAASVIPALPPPIIAMSILVDLLEVLWRNDTR